MSVWSYRYWEAKLWLDSKLGCQCQHCLQARFIRAQGHCRMKVLR